MRDREEGTEIERGCGMEGWREEGRGVGWAGLPKGSLLAASGPLVLFFFLPTLVGMGGSYFFFLS